MIAPQERRLLAELREAVTTIDPVPAHVLAAARAALSWRGVDAELAELVEDSRWRVAAIRDSAQGRRLLTFSGGGLLIEVEVSRHGEMRDLIGQVAPTGVTEVTACSPVDSRNVALDRFGHFQVRGLPAGPLRLACRAADGAVVATSWTII